VTPRRAGPVARAVLGLLVTFGPTAVGCSLVGDQQARPALVTTTTERPRSTTTAPRPSLIPTVTRPSANGTSPGPTVPGETASTLPGTPSTLLPSPFVTTPLVTAPTVPRTPAWPQTPEFCSAGEAVEQTGRTLVGDAADPGTERPLSTYFALFTTLRDKVQAAALTAPPELRPAVMETVALLDAMLEPLTGTRSGEEFRNKFIAEVSQRPNVRDLVTTMYAWCGSRLPPDFGR